MHAINPHDIAKFLGRSLGTDIHLVSIVPDGRTHGQHFGSDAALATEWATAQNKAGKNVYFTVNLVRPDCHKKPTKSDIVGVRFAHIDIDPPKDGSPWTPEDALQSLIKAKLPPTLVNWSGNGWQALWRIEGDISPEEVEAVNKGLIAAFGGDASTANVDRLLRVPGTRNYPNAAKRARGRVEQLAEIELTDSGAITPAAKLLEFFGRTSAYTRTAAAQSAPLQLGKVVPQTPDSLGIPVGDGLRLLIEEPTGDDRSADTFGFACEALRRHITPEQIAGVLTNPENAISAHCLDQRDPARAARRAVENALQQDDVARRIRQRSEDRVIAEGDESFLEVPVMSPEDMTARFVYVADGGQVADLRNPRTILTLNDFRNLTAASKTVAELPGRNGSRRKSLLPTAKIWLENPNRRTVDALAFMPGGGPITTDPEGRSAFNLWPGIPAAPPPPDWEGRVQPLIQHISWLWGDEAEPFIDWLAHMRQRPGELPSFGWLHIAPVQGLGRNWVAGVLARVFSGVTTLGFDLSSALDSGFNGMLGGKILAVVDEVAEGLVGQQHARAQALKRLVAEEIRIINPKFGRMRSERNHVRWLVLSNSPAALPLENEDRRFRVVRCDDRPRDTQYYANLYALRHDAEFVAAVSHWLAQRDISNFNPGEAPPISPAKAELLDRIRPENERILRQLTRAWPSDLIGSTDIQLHLGDERPKGAALRHTLDRVGFIRVAEWQEKGPFSKPQWKAAYAIRNAEIWKSAGLAACRQELKRIVTLATEVEATS